MSLPRITEKGFVIKEPTLKFTPSGKAVVTVPVAFNKSRKNEQGQWERTHSMIVNATAWEEYAEQIAETITSHMEVLVSGEVFVREYETKDGGKGQSVDMNLWEIGPVVSKRSRGGQRQQQSDPWGSQPSGGGFGDQSQDAPF